MTDELVDRALVIVANNIDAWGWGPISEIEGLAEHDLAVKACAAGLAAVTPQIEARVTADIVAWLRSASKHNWLAGPYDAAITAEALADAADAIERGDHRSQP